MEKRNLTGKHKSDATLEDNIKTLFELYHALEERSSALCAMIQQYHYWNPTEREVSLFNKAVTTNKTLTPAERAELDIIRMKFKRCNGIPQDKQNEVTEQDYFSFDKLEQVIRRSFLCAGVENVPEGIIKDTAKEVLEYIFSEEKEVEKKNSPRKLPQLAKVKATGKIVRICNGQLSSDCRTWIQYASDNVDGFRVYNPEDLEFLKY